MAEEIQLTPEQQAQYDQTTDPAPVEINPLRDFDANQLAELAVKDKEGFDLVGQFRQNQDLWGDAAIVQKTADALDIVKQRGFEFSDLPGPARIGKTVLESAKGFGKQLWNYAGALTGMVQGAIAEPFSTELATGFAEGVSEKLAKNIAGTEEAMAGLADIPRKVVSKVERIVSGPRTAEQKVADLWSDVGRSEVQQQRVTGQGPFTQAVTGGVAGELPAEEVATLAAGDPFSFATFSKAFQLAGKAVPSAVRTVTARAGEKVGDVSAAVGGRSIQAAGKLTELGSDAIKTISPTAGAVAGGAKGAALGGPLAVIPGIGVGAAGGRAIAKGAEKLSTAGAEVAEVGRQIAGAKPIVSATAQAGRDVLQSAPGASGTVAVGLGQDIGLSALTSETPQETEGAIGIGTALGVAGAAGRVGRRVISGQLIAPREYGVNTVTPSSGNFPALDTAHSRNIQTATPGEQTRLNAVRLFTRGAAPNTDVFFIKDPAVLSDALIQSGVPRDTANQFSQQEGFFTVNLPDRSGTPRPVIIARNVEAAPHESFHAIQDVLGEGANREIDNIVRQSYSDQWDNIGQRYAIRLAEPQGKAVLDWRETILDESGWGHAEAVDKLSRDVVNEVLGQTGAEPAPDFVQSRVRAEWSRIADEARQRNPQARPEQLWREVLSPEEATQVADRYLARELAAENFDVVFKNLGSALDSNQPLLRRLAGTSARLISTLGGEPLAGRRSEIGQIEPRFAVAEAVTAAGRLPEVQPRVPRPVVRQPVSVPTSPQAQQDAATAARDIAASAPETIPVGGTSSPRELLGQVAEAIAQRAGVKINYLSAPDQPAASILSNRPARREIIEAFRTMPPEARALWEKNFFPERVLLTKGGKYQVLGWAPEVFAANAHKLAGWLADHPTVTTAYAIDPATRSFTPDAWQQLFADTQQFVRNQQSGATGAGETLVVPENIRERGFTAPARTGGESPLSQDKADVINMLFGFKLPETPRIQKGRLPLAIVGEEISAATQPGRVDIPVRPRGEFTGIEAAAQDIAGRQITEVNPFRQRVEQAGNPPSLIESVQRLNLENIKEVALAPELPEFRGNTLTLTAGFQPQTLAGRRLKDRGYSFIGGTLGGHQVVAAFKNGLPVGFIYSRKRGGDTSHISGVSVEKSESRSGIGGALYREALSRWREQGITKFTGNIISRAPVKIREKIFGAGETKYSSPEGVLTSDEAIARLPEGDEIPKISILAESELSPKAEKSIVPVETKVVSTKPPIGEPQSPINSTEGTGFNTNRDIVSSLERDIKLGRLYLPDFARTSEPYGAAAVRYGERIWSDIYEVADRLDSNILPKEEDHWARFLQEEKNKLRWREGFYEDSRSVIQKIKDFLYDTGPRTEVVQQPERFGSIRGEVTGREGNIIDVQFQPNANPRAIKAAAARDREGKVYEGRWHGEAFEAAEAAGSETPTPELDTGFITNEGEYLTRGEAYKRADELRQLTDEGKRQLAVIKKAPVLESTIFQEQRQFQPKSIREEMDNLATRSQEDFKSFTDGYKSEKFGGGLTGWAFDLGASAKSADDVAAFRQTAETLSLAGREAMKAGEFNRAMELIGRSQAAREAFEAATGRTLDGTQEAGVPFIRKHFNPDYIPPVPPIGEPLKSAAQPAKQRKQLKFPKTSAGGFKKAWVLPSGEPVQLGGTWHHEWLSDNPEIAKKYKLDVPKFTGSDTEQVREDALRAGFARINYGVNNGQLTVEARAKDWRKVKTAVEDMVSTNLDDIDRISVTLFDDEVKQVVDSDSSSLFNLDTDQEKLAEIPFITKGEVRGQFQPAREAATEEQETLFALPDPASFTEAVIPRRGQKDIPSDLLGSPLAKQGGSRSEAISLFADKLKQEAERQNTTPAYQLGLKWYQEFTPMLRKEFGDDAELMAELLAATSPQTNVETNFGYAIDVLNNWKAGKYTKLIEKWNEGYKRLDDGSLKKIYDRDVKAGRVDNPPDKPSGATYMAWWVLKHDLLPRGTSGAQVGLHSKNVAKVLARRWLSETRGPKTKNFVKNLLGTGKEATIDIWADRLLRRIGYEGLEEKWRILPEHARGVSDDDFEFGQAVFRQAADELGVEPMDLQAALWFTEKQRWADNGWSELDLGDFRTEIKRTAEYREGFVEGRGPSEVRQGAKQATPEFEQVDLLDIRPRRSRVTR